MVRCAVVKLGVPWCIFPFKPKSKRKRERNKRQVERNQTVSKGNKDSRGFTQTTAEERQVMFDLYRQGLGTHAIASRTNRSTHTVYRVLTSGGTTTLPPRSGSEPKNRTGTRGSQLMKKRKNRGKQENPIGRVPQDPSDAFLKKIEPQLLKACTELLNSDPEVVKQIAASLLGTRFPRKTLDEIAIEGIAEDPVLRRQLAEAHLSNIKHNGRSEMDIVGDGLEMLIKLARELDRGAWAKVAGDAITSGEVRATVLGLIDAVNKEVGSENVDENLPNSSNPV